MEKCLPCFYFSEHTIPTIPTIPSQTQISPNRLLPKHFNLLWDSFIQKMQIARCAKEHKMFKMVSTHPHKTTKSKSGKIVLHLLIGIKLGKEENILGSIPNQLGSIWFHPKAMPSQTPTNHPYGFFWNINNSVPKRNWNFRSLKINYVYLSINRRNSLSESTVWDYIRNWVWLKIF